MGRLSYDDRNKLPGKSFAMPEKRAYPIEDAPHARNALSRVSQFGSAEEKGEVRSAVHQRYPGIDSPAEEAAEKKAPPKSKGAIGRHLAGGK